ncbi:MAG: SoxR reducing system RseC family protein [Deltaproteobacteria bacterium]|nr:SoxR reducing system RseC family protein [Deltaproteobacteria bacterium]
MLTEIGVVEKASPETAVVLVERSSACEQCRSKGACEMLSGRTMRVEVTNELGAEEGDRVEISLPAASVMKLSFLVYLVPVAALVAGAYLGSLWVEDSVEDPTLYAVAAGILAMIGAFLLVRRFERSASRPSSEYLPRMSRILPASEQAPPSCDNR